MARVVSRPPNDLVGLPDGFAVCGNPECFIVLVVGRIKPPLYCSQPCSRRAIYLRRLTATDACLHCPQPRVPGKTSCRYHRLRTKLRARICVLAGQPPTPRRLARLARLRSLYTRLGAAARAQRLRLKGAA